MLTDNILDLIGNTPLIRLRGESVYAKAEFLCLSGSSAREKIQRQYIATVLPDRAERYFSTALL
jgi:cysteine synthase